MCLCVTSTYHLPQRLRDFADEMSIKWTEKILKLIMDVQNYKDINIKKCTTKIWWPCTLSDLNHPEKFQEKGEQSKGIKEFGGG